MVPGAGYRDALPLSPMPGWLRWAVHTCNAVANSTRTCNLCVWLQRSKHGWDLKIFITLHVKIWNTFAGHATQVNSPLSVRDPFSSCHWQLGGGWMWQHGSMAARQFGSWCPNAMDVFLVVAWSPSLPWWPCIINQQACIINAANAWKKGKERVGVEGVCRPERIAWMWQPH